MDRIDLDVVQSIVRILEKYVQCVKDDGVSIELLFRLYLLYTGTELDADEWSQFREFVDGLMKASSGFRSKIECIIRVKEK